MPNELNKEQQDFDDVFNEIIDKTDEELAEEAGKEADPKKPSEESGDSTKENGDEEAKRKADEAELIKSVTGQAPEPTGVDNGPATGDTDVADLQSRIAELEAELKKEHQRTSSWDGRIKAANSRVKELEEENQGLRDQLAAKESAPNEVDQSDQEVMDTFKKTFPEFVEVLNIYDKKMQTFGKHAKAAPAKEKSEQQEVDPAKVDTTPDPSVDDHMTRIRDRHPDLDEMVGTGVLLTWVNKQPDYVRDHLRKVYDSGTADQVINLVSAFKNKSGWKSQLDTGDTSKEDKLNSMLEAEGESPGPKKEGPDKSDFKGTAKEIGL